MRDSYHSKKAIRDIIRLAPYTKIDSHTSGRVSLKYSLRGLIPARDIDFDELVSQIPGLLNAKVKVFSRTIVIDYDPNLLPRDLWEDLDRVKTKPELALKVSDRLQKLLIQ